MIILNIHSSGKSELAQKLSNFYPHSFVFDGVELSCFEAFLQSLKFSDPDMQRKIWKMTGREAKLKGQESNWSAGGWLYWQGKVYNRYSKEYRQLIKHAYEALCKNPQFADALRASKGKLLIHTIGKIQRRNTVLTSLEFCLFLMNMRQKLYKMERLESGTPRVE